ncbi:MAG: hypothetical protein A2Y10_13730 [Planctomycetes bacterium GWF2_41_51]|nr:MAG: hypothetical protein A2Y10_13730 [Planctomycetes bacterium GWF2_41_51]HBG25990.1 diguanylate cyclase [Phycisphaerales bacterium]
MIYNVKKTSELFKFENDWNGIGYNNVEILEISNYMGSKPEHFPKVQTKLLYDNENIYVFFKVEDQYVKATHNKLHDPVCRDSCVEFFFTPGKDISQGYFNVEINCGGTMLMFHQTARNENKKNVSGQDCEKIKISASMPKIVEPEIQQPINWTLKYDLPINMLENYTQIIKPAPGVKWRANFYKCADATSHPHWLTWSKVELPKPDFHRPEFFGTLVFD